MTAALVPDAHVTRSREPEGLRTMMTMSAIAHGAALAALVAAPWARGPHGPAAEAPLGVPAAPAAMWTDVAAPERVVEDATSRPTPGVRKPPSATKPAPAAPAGMRAGSSHLDPGSTSSEGGLSTPALPGLHAPIAGVDFCDPAYLGQMLALIHRHWRHNQTVAGRPTVRFLIQRDGTLHEIALRQPSGYPGLDLEALRAVTLTRAIPPLPACYPHPHYAMNLTFEYTR